MITSFRFEGHGGIVHFYNESNELVCTANRALDSVREIAPTLYWKHEYDALLNSDAMKKLV